MPFHSYISQPAVAEPQYGFPDLDSDADEFSAFVAAASAYVASNSLQPSGGVSPTHYGDGGSGLWTTASSYRYNTGAVNDQGLIAFPPHSQTSFYTLDTVTQTPSVFTRPEITFSGFSRWISTVWCPVTKKFFYIPDYESRYVSWHPETDVWQVFTNLAASASMQQSRYARFVNHPETGPLILIYTASNTQVRVLGTSNNIVGTLNVYGSPGVTGLMNIKRWCLGPGFVSYGCTSDAIYALIYIPSSYYFYCYPITTASAIGATNYFGDSVTTNTGFKLGADGCMYAWPSSATDLLVAQYAIRFNPTTGACDRFAMDGEPPNSLIDYSKSLVVTGIHSGESGGSIQPPTVMPDGRFVAPSYYPKKVIVNGVTAYNSFAPFMWNPAITGWQNTAATGAYNNPWGAFASQWGVHREGVIGADGCFYPAPQRISPANSQGNPESYFAYAGRFSSPPDNLPPAQFYASHYLT